MDLCQGYYQVIILEGEATNKTCMTKYGSFEFHVALFNLHIALETFNTMMTGVFRNFLDKFMVIYLDGIVIFKKRMDEHKDHLVWVLKSHRENQLYLQKFMCAYRNVKV